MAGPPPQNLTDSAFELAPADGPTVVRTDGMLPAVMAEADRRPPMAVPPPVRLVAIRDVRLPAAAGLERQLDRLYIDRLRMLRVEPDETHLAPDSPSDGLIVYRTENHDLVLDVHEPPIERSSARPTGIALLPWRELGVELEEGGIEHTLVRGLLGGNDAYLLRDPAGNWLAIRAIEILR